MVLHIREPDPEVSDPEALLFSDPRSDVSGVEDRCIEDADGDHAEASFDSAREPNEAAAVAISDEPDVWEVELITGVWSALDPKVSEILSKAEKEDLRCIEYMHNKQKYTVDLATFLQVNKATDTCLKIRRRPDQAAAPIAAGPVLSPVVTVERRQKVGEATLQDVSEPPSSRNASESGNVPSAPSVPPPGSQSEATNLRNALGFVQPDASALRNALGFVNDASAQDPGLAACAETDGAGNAEWREAHAAAEQAAWHQPEVPIVDPPGGLDGPAAESGKDVHSTILKKQGSFLSPLELAALGKLRVWSREEDDYSIEEMMGLVRWLEDKLDPLPKPSPWRELIKSSSIKKRAWAGAAVFFAFVFTLILVACATGIAIESSKVAAVRSSADGGVLTRPVEESDERYPIGVGTAVHLHTLLDYPSLPIEDLRRADDVVFKHDGAFRLYRLSSVSRLLSGGVRLGAEDGTLIMVTAGAISFTRPWATEEVVDSALNRQVASFASAGLFRAFTLLR